MPSHHTADSNVRWDLTSFYSGISDPQIDLDIAEFARQAEQFSSHYKGQLAERLGGQSPTMQSWTCLPARSWFTSRSSKVWM